MLGGKQQRIKQYAMTTAEHPITRSELREELREYATKADVRAAIAELETRMVKWMASITLAGLTAAVGLTAVLLRVLD